MRICLAGQDHVLALLAKRDFVDEMKIHFADARVVSRTKLLTLMACHPYRLASYYYLKDMRDPKTTLQALVERPEDLIVDSGLFSLMFGSEQGTMPATYEAYRDYTLRYIDRMQEWCPGCTIVEADTHKLLGMEATERLREEFAPLGSQVMYVWHYEEGLDGLVDLAKRFDYIGIGLPELRLISNKGQSGVQHAGIVNRMAMDLLRRVHSACGDRPPRIHLLGCTVKELMATSLAWSCDSTSWLSGIRFGKGHIWTADTGLHQVGIRSARFQRFREQAMDAYPQAVDFARQQKNPDYYLNCMACAYAYALYQGWLDSRYSPKPARGDALPGGPL